MTHAAIPVLSLIDDPDRLTVELDESFRAFGFAMVRDHGIDQALIERGWRLAAEFFALPEEEKRRYFNSQGGGARGYTPYRTEIAKGAAVHDLKEFWHVGREIPAIYPRRDSMQPNVWPDRPAEFRETFGLLFAEFDRVGGLLLRRIATALGLAEDWFEHAAGQGNSVLRLVHYPPLTSDPGEALRAGPHEDINLITLLLGAEEAGLELLGKDGRWRAVNPPEGALVVNIGDMLQRLTNHTLPSTTHRVRNPEGERARHSRYSMPFFVHLRSEFEIRTLPGCGDAQNPDRYPEPITAEQFLQERLRDIGLVSATTRA